MGRQPMVIEGRTPALYVAVNGCPLLADSYSAQVRLQPWEHFARHNANSGRATRAGDYSFTIKIVGNAPPLLDFKGGEMVTVRVVVFGDIDTEPITHEQQCLVISGPMVFRFGDGVAAYIYNLWGEAAPTVDGFAEAEFEMPD